MSLFKVSNRFIPIRYFYMKAMLGSYPWRLESSVYLRNRSGTGIYTALLIYLNFDLAGSSLEMRGEFSLHSH